jgi:hypothetical protein
MKVYFEVGGCGGGEIDITAYVSPKLQDGGYCAYEYDLYGKRHEFSWVEPDTARVYESSELPADMLYSIRHGVNEFRVDISKGDDWQLSDLRYDKVDKKKVQATLKGLRLIDGCKSLDDVYDVWVKYIKDNYMPFDFVQKGLAIIGQAEHPMMNGELGLYGMTNSLMFHEIMTNEYYKRNGRQES